MAGKQSRVCKRLHREKFISENNISDLQTTVKGF